MSELEMEKAIENINWRRMRLISLGLNVLFLAIIVLLSWLLWKNYRPCSCDDCFDKKQIVTQDTIKKADTEMKVIVNNVPAVKKTISAKKFFKKNPALVPEEFSCAVKESAGVRAGASTDTLYVESPCDNVRIYERDTTISDTTYSNRLRKQILRIHSYRVVVRDTILGELLGGKISYLNLDPVTATTITKFEKEKIHLYVGIAGTYNARNIGRWGLGPSVNVSFPKIGQIGYYWDGHNNAHTLNIQYQVRFKK